jgi:cyanate permease
MESLAALVAGIFIAQIAISILNIVLAALYRRGKIKRWIPLVANAVTGILALWGIATVWVMAVAPLVSVLISSILITWPRKKRAE